MALLLWVVTLPVGARRTPPARRSRNRGGQPGPGRIDVAGFPDDRTGEHVVGEVAVAAEEVGLAVVSGQAGVEVAVEACRRQPSQVSAILYGPYAPLATTW